MKSVVHDVVALGPHIPSHIERLLYQGNSPTTACVLLLQRINTSLLQVGPFESDPAEKKLVPPNAVLFAYGMLCSPLVKALEL